MSGFPSVRTWTEPACTSRGRRAILRFRGGLPSGRTRSAAPALRAGPDEEAGGPEVEASEGADLHRERALDPLDAGGLVGCHGLHSGSYSLTAVFRRLAPLVLVAAVLVLAWAGSAAAGPPPSVAARAVLVANGKTGDVLYARNEDQRLAMASITKLMTAIVTLEHRRPRDLVTVREPAPGEWGDRPSTCATGSSLRVRELLAAALIQSANDAAYRPGRRGRRRERPTLRQAHERRGEGAGPRRHAFRAPGRAGCARALLHRPKTRSGSRARR